MSELGLSAASKHKKSARTVGDVIGKYHPHGDSASLRGDGAHGAAVQLPLPADRRPGATGARPTTRRASPPCATPRRGSRASRKILISELEQGTVDWQPNFDGTLEEPRLFPARLPHVLLNGTTGIAVGMATDIPPHNLREVATACIRLLELPNTTIPELCRHIRGPDYPTEAEIISPKAEISADLRDRQRLHPRPAPSGSARTATSSSPRCRTRFRAPRCWSRSRSRCSRRSCR